MTDDLDLSRRSLLAAAGASTAALALGGLGARPAEAAAAGSPHRDLPGEPTTTPRVGGLHLQYGADAATEVVVSWHTDAPVTGPRVLLSRLGRRHERSEAGSSTSYTDAQSGSVVHVHHVALTRLTPDTDYVYAAVHDGAQPELGTVRTGPSGRAPLVFTSFGDQGTPTLGRRSGATWVNDNLGSPAAGDTVAGVERVQPLFHLLNGDLCYANLSTDRVRTWSDFWENNTRSARHRPWMPAAGNHENERGNGPIGYAAYQTYFCLPPQDGQDATTAGLWYAFTAGSVRVISLANDDVAYQDGGNSYVRGYSGGAQKAWLEQQLAAARSDRGVDWVVVCMHQVAISTADKFNGADLGVREEWLPLFDRYGVDVVVCGHEHHYERSHPVRGAQDNATRTPVPVSTRTDVVDTSRGTVHMVLGGGGTSAPSNGLFFDPPACRVITAVTAPDPVTGKRAPVYVQEPAPWSAVRDRAQPYGFAAFSVDPGTRRGGTTRMTVTYYEVTGPYGELSPFETFVLERRRADAR